MVSMKIYLSKIKNVHFIGIGGVGVSAVARLMHVKGKRVTGSDRSKGKITDELEKTGIKVFEGHNESNILDDVDLVIYTIAIDKNNPEIKKAKRLKIPLLTYPEFLGLISKDMFVIAISGTHGKTTTTAMVGKILIDAGLDPTVIVGSLMKESGSNLVVGKSKYLVVEACEYRESFLNLNPDILLINNIDNDHLDYYKNISNIRKAFKKFIGQIKPGGVLVTNMKDDNVLKIIGGFNKKVVDYSVLGHVVKLKVIGEHNISNAKAAFAIGNILGIDKKIISKSLSSFSGTWRRLEYKGKTNIGVLMYDDYGHHPTEIKASLSALRKTFPKKKIFAVFQPHLYSRTKSLLGDFKKSFSDADFVIVSPIYAAREKFDKSISSEKLVMALKSFGTDAIAINSFEEIARFLLKNVKKGGIVVTIGAGDIFKVCDILILMK